MIAARRGQEMIKELTSVLRKTLNKQGIYSDVKVMQSFDNQLYKDILNTPI